MNACGAHSTSALNSLHSGKQIAFPRSTHSIAAVPSLELSIFISYSKYYPYCYNFIKFTNESRIERNEDMEWSEIQWNEVNLTSERQVKFMNGMSKRQSERIKWMNERQVKRDERNETNKIMNGNEIILWSEWSELAANACNAFNWVIRWRQHCCNQFTPLVFEM